MTTMKKIFTFVLFFALVYSTEANTKFSFLKPNKHGKLTKIQVKGRDWTYYRLDKSHPLEISIEGPVELRFITRLDMEQHKSGQKIDYKIYCRTGNKKTHFTHSAVISKGIEFSATGVGKIGAGEDFNLSLPAGTHKVKLYLAKNDKSIIYIRPLQEKKRVSSDPKRVAMDPQKFTRQVKILVKESQYEYFRVGNQDSLNLRIIGPSTIKAFSRLEYDVTMNGEKNYRLQVYEDGSLKNTFLLNTIISETAVYMEQNADKILSRGDDFYIEVPKGVHEYTFKVLDSGRSSLLKFYIPEKDLKNTQ